MPRFDNPIVLVTRPKDGAERFVDALRNQAGPFRPVINPAFENTRIDAVVPEFQTAIFTSRAGVAFAPSGDGRTAICVGDATAQAAQTAGFETISAEGNADDLVRLILGLSPTGPLLHVRGEVSRGNITACLRGAGIACNEAIVYRKSPKVLGNAAMIALQQGGPIILPLFSAETVSIVANWALCTSGVHVVGISREVAQEARVLKPVETHVADAPNLTAMVAATARLIA